MLVEKTSGKEVDQIDFPVSQPVVFHWWVELGRVCFPACARWEC